MQEQRVRFENSFQEQLLTAKKYVLHQINQKGFKDPLLDYYNTTQHQTRR